MEPPQTTTTTAAAISSDDIDGGGPTNIVKGKRTKRQRLQSSVPFAILPQSSTSNNIIINPTPNSNPNTNPNSSSTSSSDVPTNSTTTEEEDTAKCLILLSQGHNLLSSTNNIIINNNNHEFSTYKFNSKRYIPTSTDPTVDGFTGIYVYECKTCSRTFPSFQALGATEPAIKNLESTKTKKTPADAIHDFFRRRRTVATIPVAKKNSSPSSSLSLQLNHPRVSSTKKPASKLHECSICGTEFNSGQALGGHMRRHRVANATNASAAMAAANTTLSLIPYNPVTIAIAGDDRDNYQKSRNDHGLCLDLDLNLPAPPEASNQDHRREASFTFPAKKQPAVHLSATPTLVDCHY
ncbi:hypothetical protein OSB04_026631 [Centaurea solstitialis]|uniref:C2H2-type domain-containing protein n=1 Tax=Centaurea solstitialis TaxID=347529 RepID=A0AA38W624_9ASTR|nr:hypothetical protein OSB04_026631 [Centaurea solstitialis]